MNPLSIIPRFARLMLWTGLALISPVAALAVSVTFQVNMGVQAALGTFNAASGHLVELHGSFDSWGPGSVLSVSSSDPDIYQVDVDLVGNPGSEVQYKFVINQSGTQVWESDGVGTGGAANRAVNVPTAPETLPVVYFNNQASPPVQVEVTFRIDMSIQEALGNFNPAAGDVVEAHGSFDNWGAGVILAVDPNNADIYQGVATISGSVGAPIEHKFVINHSGTQVWEGNVGSGGPFGNRVFNLAESPQVLPVVFFNNLSENPGTGIPVTFQVSLSVPVARGLFDPASGVVTVAGEFNNWNTTASPLTNSVENPTLYTGTYNLTTVAPGASVAHKFVLNGGTWETGDNRAFTLQGPTQTLPVEYFDRVPNLGAVSYTVTSLNPLTLTVSWTAGPLIRLQQSNTIRGPWEDVPDTLGQGSAVLEFPPQAPPATFLRLVGP